MSRASSGCACWTRPTHPHHQCTLLQEMPTFMKIVCAAMVAVTQGSPVLGANDALDARVAQLEAKIKALDHTDVPPSVVKKFTVGKFESCEEVSSFGLCEMAVAAKHCPNSCKATRVTAQVTAQVSDGLAQLLC